MIGHNFSVTLRYQAQNYSGYGPVRISGGHACSAGLFCGVLRYRRFVRRTELELAACVAYSSYALSKRGQIILILPFNPLVNRLIIYSFDPSSIYLFQLYFNPFFFPQSQFDAGIFYSPPLLSISSDSSPTLELKGLGINR